MSFSPDRRKQGRGRAAIKKVRVGRKGTNGVGTKEVTADFCFFDSGTFWVLPLTCLYLPKSARAYLFPDVSNILTLAAAPLVLTPFVRNQVKSAAAGTEKREKGDGQAGGWQNGGGQMRSSKRYDDMPSAIVTRCMPSLRYGVYGRAPNPPSPSSTER